MNTEILEIPIDSENDDLFYVYFLYNTFGDLLYIGKTTRLRARMRQHLVSELVKVEPWRDTVDRNNIVTFKCSNACDMDLYETYFINKYNPIYNKDKIFNISPTFDFPYIEPVVYKFKLKVIVGDGSFKDNCIKYIESEEDRELLALKYPLIKKSYEKLGADRMKALNYLPAKLTDELHFRDIKTQQIIKQELIDILEIGVNYPLNQLKEFMNTIYSAYNINKKAKAIDVSHYFDIKVKGARDGKKINKVIQILNIKE